MTDAAHGTISFGGVTYPVRDPGPAVLAELTAAHEEASEDRLLPGPHVVALQQRVTDPADRLGPMELVMGTVGLWRGLSEQHSAGNDHGGG